jgi:hypothetical protein
LNVPSGLRMPPLIPLILTDLSADRARALPGLPMPGLFDKGCLLRFESTALLGLEFRACVLSCVSLFVKSSSSLGEQLRPGRPDKTVTRQVTARQSSAPKAEVELPVFCLQFRYTTGEGGWVDGQKLKLIYLPWELNRSSRQAFISHGQKIRVNYFPMLGMGRGLGGEDGSFPGGQPWNRVRIAGHKGFTGANFRDSLAEQGLISRVYRSTRRNYHPSSERFDTYFLASASGRQ